MNSMLSQESSQVQGFSVLVTTWNNAASIGRCLRSVESLFEGDRERIFVGDCGSSDGTLQIVRQEFPAVEILCSGSPRSFAQVRNLALQKASGRWLLMLEGDWGLDAASFRELLHKLASDPSLAIAVPRFCDPDGSLQIGHNVRRFPSAASLCSEYLLVHKLWPREPSTRRYRMLDFDHAQDRRVDHACGAVILADRGALLEAGGYDDDFAPAWMEDVDLSRRLAARGRGTLFCHRAEARHIGRETTRHFLIEARYGEFYRGVLLYARRYLGIRWQAVRLCLILGLLAKIGFSYLIPVPLRRWLLRRYRIYNSEAAIRGYRRQYFDALRIALKGETRVQPGQPPALAGRLLQGASSAPFAPFSPDD